MRRHMKADSPIRYSRHMLLNGLKEHLKIALCCKLLLECVEAEAINTMGVSWLLDVTLPPYPFINRRNHEVMVKHADGESCMSQALKQSNSLSFMKEIALFYEHGNASSGLI
jgi:hypothetical protein